jgi:hypothetical protein
MSVAMDSQDLRGYLRGLCLIIVVRVTDRAISKEDIQSVLGQTFSSEIKAASSAIANFTGIEENFVSGGVEDLFQANEDFLKLENLNLQLGLLCGRPVPVFPFVRLSSVNHLALLLPFLIAARNLVHAAVRLRMQLIPPTPPDLFWRAMARFLCRVGGDDEVSAAFAVTTVANVISDVIFFNSDSAGRTEDPILAARISRVLNELATIDISALLA